MNKDKLQEMIQRYAENPAELARRIERESRDREVIATYSATAKKQFVALTTVEELAACYAYFCWAKLHDEANPLAGRDYYHFAELGRHAANYIHRQAVAGAGISIELMITAMFIGFPNEEDAETAGIMSQLVIAMEKTRAIAGLDTEPAH